MCKVFDITIKPKDIKLQNLKTKIHINIEKCVLVIIN